MDVFITLTFIALFFWLLLLIPVAFLLLGYQDIFFVQRRIGYQEEIFKLYKFRTLKKDSALPLAERRFKFGDFLRLTSLDELPQLLNVLNGKMSLVGPRPLPVEYLPLFSEGQRHRHSVKPGITGWAQVNGRNAISWEKKFELDNYYVQHLSLAQDVKILAMTVRILFSFSKDVSLTEEKFNGNTRP